MTEPDATDIARSILDRIDNPTPVRTCFQLVEEIAGAVSAAGDLQNAVAELVKHDWLACGLVTRALIVSPDPTGTHPADRITGAGKYADGSVWPDPSTFSQEDLDSLAGRASQTSNPVIKARYFHLAYALAANKQRLHAQLAIDAYLESARLFDSSERLNGSMEIASDFDQATALALTVQDKERLEKIVANVVEALRGEPEDRHSLDGKVLPVGRFHGDFAAILLYIANTKMNAIIKEDVLQMIVDRMKTLVKRNEENALYVLNSRLYRIAEKAETLLKHTASAYQLSVDRIEGFVKQAEVEGERAANRAAPLISAKFYEDAINLYERLKGQPEITAEQRKDIDKRLNELRLSLKNAYRNAREQNAYSTLSVEIDMDEDRLERDTIINELLSAGDLSECLDQMVKEGFLLPNVQLAQEQAEEAVIDTPLRMMLSRTHVSDDLPVAHATTEDERLAAERDKNIMLWIQINTSALLIPLFDRLHTEKGMEADSLAAYFERWGFVTEQDIEFLRRGFELYYAKDYMSSLHILVTRYEPLLRGVFEDGGTAAFRSRRTQAGSESETLGSFLNKESVKNALPEDLRQYIRLILAEQTGWNLRNRIAHGLISLQECTKLEATAVIHLLLLLTLVHVASEPNGD